MCGIKTDSNWINLLAFGKACNLPKCKDARSFITVFVQMWLASSIYVHSASSFFPLCSLRIGSSTWNLDYLYKPQNIMTPRNLFVACDLQTFNILPALTNHAIKKLLGLFPKEICLIFISTPLFPIKCQFFLYIHVWPDLLQIPFILLNWRCSSPASLVWLILETEHYMPNEIYYTLLLKTNVSCLKFLINYIHCTYLHYRIPCEEATLLLFQTSDFHIIADVLKALWINHLVQWMQC